MWRGECRLSKEGEDEAHILYSMYRLNERVVLEEKECTRISFSP